MIDKKINELNQKISKVLKDSKTGPYTLVDLLDKLLDSLNVEADAAVENAERVLELNALNTLGNQLSSAATSTVDAILKIVDEQASLLMKTNNLYIAFYNKNLDRVSFPFVRENGKLKKPVRHWAPRKTGNGLTEYIIRNQTSLFIPSDVDDWMLKHQDEVTRTGNPAKSWLGVPMINRDELIGVIAVQDYEKENTFDNSDLNVLATIANHAAIAITNANLFQSNQRQADDALQLRQVSQTINSTIELKKVLDRVVKGARKVMNADLVVLYPMKQGKFGAPIIDGKSFTEFKYVELPKPKGLASTVLNQGFLAVNDLEENPDINSKYVEGEKIRSFAGIALKVGGEVVDGEIVGGESVGVLYFNYRRTQTFGEMERNIIYLFAAQAATAIQNARLFDQTRSNLERRDKEFKAIERINLAITSQNQDVVLESILEAAIEIIKVPTGHVLLVDDSDEYLEIKAARGSTNIEDIPKKYKIGEEGSSGWVAKNKKTALIRDVNNLNPELKNFYRVAATDTKSSVTVPLLDDYDNNKLLGVINLESNEVDAFTNNDQLLLEALARQASIAIRNQKLYEIEKRTSKEAEVLSDVDKKISSTLELGDVLQFILDEGLELMDVPKGNIMLYDKVKGDLYMAVGRGEDEKYKGARQAVGEGIVGLAAQKKHCFRVSDVTARKWKNVYQPFIPGMRSELAVPLIHNDELIGVINAESPMVGDFSLNDQQLLKKLGDHAVIAIHNAERYEQLKALREIDLGIISANNVDQILDLILDNALRLTGAEIGDIFLVEPITKDLVLHNSRFPEEVEVDEAFKRFPFGQGITGWSISNRESIIIDDALKDTRYIPYFQRMRSEIVVPLLMETDVLGAISLESPQVAAFDKRDLQILEALAGQAVIAIQKAEANTRAENESNRFRMLHRAGQELGHIVDLSQVKEAYKIIVRIAQERTQSRQTVIRRYDERTKDLVLVESVYLDAVSPYERMGINDGLNGQVARDQKTIIVNNVERPPNGVSIKPSDQHIKSMVITPIRFEDHYYGNLGLSHQDIGHFAESDTELIEGLSNQLAITLHRLDETGAKQLAEQRAGEAEAMGSIGQSAFELAHRLGNNLGLVRSYRNNILDELEKLKLKSLYIEEQLDNIVSDVKRVLDLSSELKGQFHLASLSRTKMEGKIVPTKKILISVRELIKVAGQLANMAIDEGRSFRGNFKVNFDVAEDVGSVYVQPNQIEDALRNLITNAVQAMPEGGTITLRARNVGKFVEIQVVDTGPGIDPEIQPRIFDLFFSTKESSGFGLWSTRANALANGGEIRVESQLGSGATFTLALPNLMQVEETDLGK